MTPERWLRVRQIVEEVWERDATERAPFLDRVCAGDDELRAAVEDMLAEDQNVGDFLETPPHLAEIVEATLAAVEQRETDLAGVRVGRYTIQSLIGKGGMGAVYRAVREDDFRMQVAIKLLKRGTDTDAALGRFRAERQILAGLQHPNIARLLDGGATDAGLPYLVMEYVDGTPLLEYAAPLPVRRRLELFRLICLAVQFAHQNRVVHRDIKPSNMLVTLDGIPKLLDFGIAKLLDPAAGEMTMALTAAGGVLMTPGYASPEQVLGRPVTMATDIYSLGAVLYELLTGQPAHTLERFSLEEIQNEVCLREPPRPSTVRKELDTDLDNIVLMALRKEPERRYASVAQMAGDIDRFLQDLPIQARRESLLYRGRKFLKRHRALITSGAAGAVIVLALAGGLRRVEFSPALIPPKKPNIRARTSSDRWDHWSLEKIAAIGDPAPGGGLLTKAFEPWALNSRGDLAFATDLSAGNQGIFLLRNGESQSLSPVARAGESAPGGGTFDQGPIGLTSMNNAGDMAFSFGLKPFFPPTLRGYAKAGLYRYSQLEGRLSAVVIPGVTVAPGTGVLESTSLHATLNKSGYIVFTGIVRTAAGLSSGFGLGAGIFLANPDARITKVVVPGDPAPGGGKFDFAQNAWINDQGDIAFGGHVAGEECINIETIGPSCGESVFLKRAEGALESIAHQGEQVPGGSLLRFAWGPLLNNRGDAVFMGELTPRPGLGTARGIYLYSQGATVRIAGPGDVMPDGRAVKTVNPSGVTGNYSLNNPGDVSFNASLENGESGMYVYSGGSLHLVAGTGTVIPGQGTVANISNDIVGGGPLNDSGQLLFGASLTDGRKILLLAKPRPADRTKR